MSRHRKNYMDGNCVHRAFYIRRTQAAFMRMAKDQNWSHIVRLALDAHITVLVKSDAIPKDIKQMKET